MKHGVKVSVQVKVGYFQVRPNLNSVKPALCCLLKPSKQYTEIFDIVQTKRGYPKVAMSAITKCTV